jgi:hypothetical protein
MLYCTGRLGTQLAGEWLVQPLNWLLLPIGKTVTAGGTVNAPILID